MANGKKKTAASKSKKKIKQLSEDDLERLSVGAGKVPSALSPKPTPWARDLDSVVKPTPWATAETAGLIRPTPWATVEAAGVVKPTPWATVEAAGVVKPTPWATIEKLGVVKPTPWATAEALDVAKPTPWATVSRAESEPQTPWTAMASQNEQMASMENIPGRYSVVTSGDSVVKYDSATGKSWILKTVRGKPGWVSLD